MTEGMTQVVETMSDEEFVVGLNDGSIDWTTLQPHTETMFFTRGSSLENEALESSIKRNGFNAAYPIQILDGKVIDGMRRFAATMNVNAELAEKGKDLISPCFVAVSVNKQSIAEYVAAANLDRRQIDPLTKVVLAGLASYNSVQGQRANRYSTFGEWPYGKSSKVFNTNTKFVELMRDVLHAHNDGETFGGEVIKYPLDLEELIRRPDWDLECAEYDEEIDIVELKAAGRRNGRVLSANAILKRHFPAWREKMEAQANPPVEEEETVEETIDEVPVEETIDDADPYDDGVVINIEDFDGEPSDEELKSIAVEDPNFEGDPEEVARLQAVAEAADEERRKAAERAREAAEAAAAAEEDEEPLISEALQEELVSIAITAVDEMVRGYKAKVRIIAERDEVDLSDLFCMSDLSEWMADVVDELSSIGS